GSSSQNVRVSAGSVAPAARLDVARKSQNGPLGRDFAAFGAFIGIVFRSRSLPGSERAGGRAAPRDGALPRRRTPASSMGLRGRRESPRSQSNRDEVGAHPTGGRLVEGPKGQRKPPWPMGSRGAPEAPLVMGVGSRNAPDWRCNGHHVALAR